MKIRINKFFTEYGLCSRRVADTHVREGRVTINGRIAVLGDKVAEGDVVTLNGERVGLKKEKELLVAYHKPVGVECTMDERDPQSLAHHVDLGSYFFMIGRLDQNSEGLLLLTNQGDWVNRVLRSRFAHEKEYMIYLDRIISDDDLQSWRDGVEIGDTERGPTLPCEVERHGESRWIRVVLKEGRNRQLRRVADVLGYQVKRLKRVRVANIVLGVGLPRGECRPIEGAELKEFKRLIKA